MNFFEEVAIDDSFMKVENRQIPFFVMIDVNKKIIKIKPALFRFWEKVRDFTKTKADRFYSDKAPWLVKGIIPVKHISIKLSGKEIM